jgi:hypothetical protein
MPGGPLEDAIETVVEVRDCLAINDKWWENALDCGFATWEVGTSAANGSDRDGPRSF